MKKIIILPAFLAALGLAACEDMDTVPEGNTVLDSQKTEIARLDPSKSMASVYGAFKGMYSVMPNSTDIHVDLGFPMQMLLTDYNGEDLVSVSTGYNWLSSSVEYTNRAVSSTYSEYMWNNLYNYIYTANKIIKSFADDSEIGQWCRAEGYALRAFAYFNLAQLYQFNKVGHEESPCVPIITEENSEDFFVNGGKRATVQEVYDLIYSDIDKAIETLSSVSAPSIDKIYISLATAYGIRARVNLVCREWAAALSDAENAIANAGGIAPASIDDVSKPSFVSYDENNWMWGIPTAETDAVVSSGIVNWPSHINIFSYGYAYASGGKLAMISKKLFDTISDTDVRKGWWLDADQNSANLPASYLAFAQANGSPYGCVKFAPYGNTVLTTTAANDIPMMRIEEMYLIKAEALSRTGGDAASFLNEFVKTYRDPEYSFDGADINTEIWRQRRIELWGEGLNWFDIMRLETGVDRRNTGFGVDVTFVIDATDTKLLWNIPENEVEQNPALTEADYNPVTTSPQPYANGDATLDSEKVGF